MEVSDKSIELVVSQLATWGPWGVAFLVFMIWGMPHIAPIITSLGTIFNERHKTNLSHKRSMSKIGNQAGTKSAGPPMIEGDNQGNQRQLGKPQRK